MMHAMVRHQYLVAWGCVVHVWIICARCDRVRWGYKGGDRACVSTVKETHGCVVQGSGLHAGHGIIGMIRH